MNEKEVLQTLLDKQKKRVWIGAIILVVILGVVGICSTISGKADIQIAEVWQIIFAKLSGQTAALEEIKKSTVSIVWNIRLPRIIAGILVGMGLAIAGVIFQAVLMNPLADSFTMGVSPGAAFGASIALFVGMFFNLDISIPLFAFLGAMGSLLVVLYLAKVDGYATANNLIICGIIISSVLSAGISFIKSMAGEQVAAIVNWLIGSLAARTWEQVLLIAPWLLLLGVLCVLYADYLNVLSLGDQEARNLGISVTKVRYSFLFAAALLTALCVSISGIIGFIGLIVPHILRMAIGSDNRYLLPLAGLCGACLLATADLAARVLLSVELPVGVLTTLLGGPFFFYIFKLRKKQMAD